MSENRQISIDELGVTQEQITAAILSAASNEEVQSEPAQDEEVHRIPLPFAFQNVGAVGEDPKLNSKIDPEEYDKKIKEYNSAKRALRSRAMSIIDKIDMMDDGYSDKDIVRIMSILTTGVRLSTDIELLCEAVDDIHTLLEISDPCFSEFNSSDNVVNKLSKDEVLVVRKNM